MTHPRALRARLTLGDGSTVEVAGEDAHRLYLGHNFIARMGQKRLGVIGGRNEFERWRQQQVLDWLAEHERPELPRVLIIGDSIRMRLNDCTGYGLYAYKLLLGDWNISHIPHNTGGSKAVRGHIDDWLSSRPDVVHLHAGLHDLAVTSRGEGGPKHVSPDTYRDNLRFIVDRIRSAPSVRHLIWGRITPVVDAWHNLPTRRIWRYQADVDHYNAIADEVMRAAGVEINDLAAPVHEMGARQGLLIDGVHLHPAAASVLGRQVAARISAARPS